MAASLGNFLVLSARAHGVDEPGLADEAKLRARYREDPAAYAREKLGVQLWDKQVEILDAARESKRVAVRSGHKVSKSHTAAILALWFYDCFDDARVVISCVTARQVDAIIWREVRKMRARSKTPIAGEMHDLARSGFKSADFREIVGFTAKEAEAVAGVSGANLLYLLDEASGIPDAIFEAIEGNRAGGARVVMFSNPTQTTGEFFDAFNKKKEFYRCVHISSEDTPNAKTGREIVPGLATREWIEEKKREWGTTLADGTFEPGPLYLVRVRGEFVLNEEGRCISLHLIQQAEARWADTPEEGRLHIGLDPAGPGAGGDETAFAVRRGMKVLGLYTFRGLNEEAHLAHLLGIIADHRDHREPPPIVKLDREGPIGWQVLGCLRAHLDQHADAFELVPVRSSSRAKFDQRYETVRDELVWNLSEWMKAGGAIPEDAKLAQELHAPEWKDNGTALKVTPKSELRKILERSPDRFDAVTLAVWSPLSSLDVPKAPVFEQKTAAATVELDPYDDLDGSSDVDRVFDPYGGR